MNQKFISSPSPTPLGDFFMLVLDYREIISDYVICLRYAGVRIGGGQLAGRGEF